MAGIAAAGLGLGTLADRRGRRRTIVIGLTAFAAASFLFAIGHTFLFFVVLMGISGLGIGVFKTGALALVGDISTSTTEHTSIMNTVEGFFSVGSIAGPAVLAYFLARGVSWQWLYVVAGALCVFLIVTALSMTYPVPADTAPASPRNGTMAAATNPYVLAFSGAVFLYVGVEAAIYVWMPTLLADIGDASLGWRLTTFRSSSRCAPRDGSSARGRCCGGDGRRRWRLERRLLGALRAQRRGRRGAGRYLLPARGSSWRCSIRR